MSIMSSFAVAAIRKVLLDAVSDPEKILKIIFIVFLSLFFFIVLLLLPAYLVVSMPLILLSGGNVTQDPVQIQQLQKLQQETKAIYENAPAKINEEMRAWMDRKEQEYSYADSITTYYNCTINWVDLLAIDAHLLGQDYNKASETNILNLARKFIKRESYTTTYTVQESYTVYVNGKPETKYRTVTKTRAVIKVSTKSVEEVLTEMNASDQDKAIILNMIAFTSSAV